MLSNNNFAKDRSLANVDISEVLNIGDTELALINSGEILILGADESTALIVQHALHAEFVTPGSAVGGSFDREVTEVYTIGDVSLTTPANAAERQQAIRHRQADIDRMLQFWKEKDTLERTVSFLTMLCQRFGSERSRSIQSDFLLRLTGSNPELLDRAWDRVAGVDLIDITNVVRPIGSRQDPAPPLQRLPTATRPQSLNINSADAFTSSELSAYPASAFSSAIQVSSMIVPPKRRTFPWRFLFVFAGLTLAGAGILFYTLSQVMGQKSAPVVSVPIVPQKPQLVSALGFIEPQGEVIKLSAPAFMEGSRIDKLLVRQGDFVRQGATVAVLDNRDRLQSILEQAQQSVKISEAKLQQVQAGSKTGDIQAQKAKSRRSKAELEGQVIAQQAAIANVQAQLEGERGTQEALILQVKAELNHADKECSRYQMLEEGGAVSKSQRDNTCLNKATTRERLAQANSTLTKIVSTRQKQISEANANLKRSIATLQNEVEAADASTNSVSEVRPVDVQLANQEIVSAKAAVKKARADLAQAYVKSPMTGQVLKIHTFPGELVGQKGIVELGRTEQMFVNANIYETDIARIRTGQKAIVRADGVIGALTGYVDRVGIRIGTPSTLGTDPVREADVRVVEVKIRLVPADSKKVRNLTNLQVNVAIDTKS